MSDGKVESTFPDIALAREAGLNVPVFAHRFAREKDVQL